MYRIRLALAAPLALLSASGLLMGLAGPASAQVANKTVGAYMISTGWQTSPAYVGFQNTIQLFVNDSNGNGVDGLANGLKLVVSFNGQSPFPIGVTGSFDPTTNQGNHGEYDAPIIPTAVGNYTFHFTGNIKGQPLDESFTSSDSSGQTFQSVQDPSSIEYPSSLPAVNQLANQLGNTAASLNSRVSSASSSSGTAIALGIAALVVAVVFGGVGLVLGITARRSANAVGCPLGGVSQVTCPYLLIG